MNPRTTLESMQLRSSPLRVCFRDFLPFYKEICRRFLLADMVPPPPPSTVFLYVQLKHLVADMRNRRPRPTASSKPPHRRSQSPFPNPPLQCPMSRQPLLQGNLHRRQGSPSAPLVGRAWTAMDFARPSYRLPRRLLRSQSHGTRYGIKRRSKR